MEDILTPIYFLVYLIVASAATAVMAYMSDDVTEMFDSGLFIFPWLWPLILLMVVVLLPVWGSVLLGRGAKWIAQRYKK